ncbi:hypothetical protein SELMODRAFT_425112 [Selaginella moellendorffii]|uniref:Ribosomal protein L10 n=1 Tax=Selaginella moellendorffii TaxID=88036 RepID=D8SS19_SELML|nr:hypothetical protein SELMODRAFT_425112 [Selaginella moellendorffii]
MGMVALGFGAPCSSTGELWSSAEGGDCGEGEAAAGGLLPGCGVTVQQMQNLRRSLPEKTKLMVAKNTLVGKAIEGTKWEALKPCLKGMNAWLFVHTEEIPAALKPYRAFQKELKLDSDFTGAVFEGKFYAPFNQLETMPSSQGAVG